MNVPVLRIAMTVAAATLLLDGAALGQEAAPASEGFVSDFSRIDAADAAARSVAESSRSARSAIITRPVAPDPQAFAASAGQTPMRISAPGSEPVTITPGATSGTTIVVPSNAQVRVPEEPAAAYEVYDPAVGEYITAPDYATSVEYESLIRAGGPPSYSITTLHTPGPYNRVYRPSYSRTSPYIYQYGDGFRSSYTYDRSAYHRYNYHNRPFSSGLGYTRYDPLGSSLHRSAQLRFHEASRPRLHSPTVHDDHRSDHSRGRSTRDTHNNDRSRDRSTRDARPLNDSGRDRSPRAPGGGNNRAPDRFRRSPK